MFHERKEKAKQHAQTMIGLYKKHFFIHSIGVIIQEAVDLCKWKQKNEAKHAHWNQEQLAYFDMMS